MNQASLLPEPKEKTLKQTVIRLQAGDLTALEVDAFVFYARENLEIGSGFGTAIQVRGGDSIKKELQAIGRIGMGESVITSAGNMAAKHIIHTCGPKFHEPDLERKLRESMLSALQCAAQNGLKTVAFPAMGAGFYGIPLDLCATVMLEVIKDFLQGETSLEEVIICVVDDREFKAFQDKFERL
jgi:O-acetyl-ADP-ribose deacetylase (regulator of RNase III)